MLPSWVAKPMRPTRHALQVELLKVQHWVQESGQKFVLLFEGRDAAGKGGTIKRFTEHLNPREARVVALNKPSDEERGQWYFQRYVKHLPTAGEMVLSPDGCIADVPADRLNGFPQPCCPHFPIRRAAIARLHRSLLGRPVRRLSSQNRPDRPAPAGVGLRGFNRGTNHIRTHHHTRATARWCIIDVAVFADAKTAQIMGVQLPFAVLQGLAGQAGPQNSGEQFGEQRHNPRLARHRYSWVYPASIRAA
ncbi:Polyphosphate:ADP/GDP phosphotransferase [Nymphon striatum]|nr:Polyphosphate:ADP/GDP phosphotransferase [Nymphon striatum]